MTNPVTSIKEATMNIQQFQDILVAGNSGTPAHTRFSAFKNWYYDPALDAFGPGKFIGYQGTTVANYKGNGAGKETKRALAAFFVPLDKRSALYPLVGKACPGEQAGRSGNRAKISYNRRNFRA